MGASIAVNHENFATEVVEQSFQKPVLVDFFAQWCGPCQMLKPLLERLVQEYDFVLAKVDIDASPDLAQTYGVEGVPDVRIVVDGQVNEGFVGVLPEPQLRELLAQLNLKSQLDESLQSFYTAVAQGKNESAQLQLSQLLQQYPENRELWLEGANFYIQINHLEAADAILDKIPAHEKEFFGRAKALKALLQFKRIASEPLGDSEVDRNFQEAARSVLAKTYEKALEQLLTIVEQNRRYRDDGARKAILAIFDLVGENDPLTKTFRKRLTMALY